MTNETANVLLAESADCILQTAVLGEVVYG